MNREVSAYLDSLRLLCGILIVIGHVETNWIPGLSGFLIPLGNESLAILFALSGFVIGFASDKREPDLKSYLVHRAARVYSLLIPCVAFGFALDSVGKHFMAHYYLSGSWPKLESDSTELLISVFSFTFLTEVWNNYLSGGEVFPGSMAPYWTLPYEVAYYLLFAFAWYLRGWKRPVALLAVTLAIGPGMLRLLPLWLTGLATYHLAQQLKLGVGMGRAIFAISMLVLLAGNAAIAYTHYHFGFGYENAQAMWPLYVTGIWFGALTLGFRFAAISINRYTGWVKWGAGASATLYILHFPLGRFVNGLIPVSWPWIVRWVTLVSTILVVTALFASVSERRKEAWRHAIEAGLAWAKAFSRSRKLVPPKKLVARGEI